MAGAGDGGSRTPELRKDSVCGRWVIFSPARSKRPSDFKSRYPATVSGGACAFCAGNEHQCAPEIFRIPEASGFDWKIRVIHNLYSALSRDLEELFLQSPNPNPNPNNNLNNNPNPNPSPRPINNGDCSILGFGFHDVVIESPVHSVQMCDLSPLEIGNVFLAYKKRILQLSLHESVKYIQVFKNHWASAGASMSHSHSQIIALPVVPSAVSARIDSVEEYYDRTGECSLCGTRTPDLNIFATAHFVAFAPFASAFPFEVWITPIRHSPHFSEIDTEEVEELGWMVKVVMTKVNEALEKPPFNFVINTSPLHVESRNGHWFIQFVPQLSTTAGFEIGTGCHINPVFPEDAARLLRQAEIRPDGSEGRFW